MVVWLYLGVPRSSKFSCCAISTRPGSRCRQTIYVAGGRTVLQSSNKLFMRTRYNVSGNFEIKVGEER